MVSLNRFRGVPEKRIERIYVGGIRKECNEGDMRDFLNENNVKFTFIRFFTRGNYSNSAQLNVHPSEKEKLYNPKFWPGGIFVKRWLSRRLFREHFDSWNTPDGN